MFVVSKKFLLKSKKTTPYEWKFQASNHRESLLFSISVFPCAQLRVRLHCLSLHLTSGGFALL